MSSLDASSPSQTAPAPHPAGLLDYSPTGRTRHKRLLRGLCVLSVLVVALGAWLYLPPLAQHAQMLYAQRQCLRYTPPADQVVFESEPAAAARLLGDPRYRRARVYQVKPSDAVVTAAALTPACWTRMEASISSPHLRQPSSPPAIAVIFMGERKTPSGEPRLVVVTYFPYPAAGGNSRFVYGYEFIAYVLTPGTLGSAPMVYRNTGGNERMAFSPNPARVRVYAGQPDATDASHFTIRCIIDGIETIIDGHLDDRERVTLTPRPAKPGPSGPGQTTK